MIRPHLIALAWPFMFVAGCSDLVPIAETGGSSTEGSGTDTTGTAAVDSSSDGGGSSDTMTSPPATEGEATDTTDGGPVGTSEDTGLDPDADADGFPASLDCDDDDPEVHPGAVERCNGQNDDCDFKTGEAGVVSIDGMGSWPSIGAAVAAAAPGAELRICAGTYAENVTIDQDLTLVSQDGAAVTIIDGGAAGPVVSIDGGVVNLVDLTLRGGDSFGFGGGLSVLGTDLVTLQGCVVSDNSSSDGAGIYSSIGTSLALEQTTISGNVGGIGGGVAFYGTSMSMTDCTVEGNDADEIGGGMFLADAGTLELTSTSVIDNTSLDGGGLALSGVMATVSNSVVARNVATASGGGAYLDGGASLLSVDSDWGAAADDNTPNDVEIQGIGEWLAYGAGASFECDAAGCM